MRPGERSDRLGEGTEMEVNQSADGVMVIVKVVVDRDLGESLASIELTITSQQSPSPSNPNGILKKLKGTSRAGVFICCDSSLTDEHLPRQFRASGPDQAPRCSRPGPNGRQPDGRAGSAGDDAQT